MKNEESWGEPRWGIVRFRSLKIPYKTNGKSTFLDVGKRIHETLGKQMPNGRNSVQKRKMASKIIEKHYLEKVFATRFLNIKKPYKANGKTTF